MLAPLRRLYRRFFPQLRHPLLDRTPASLPNDARYAALFAEAVREWEPEHERDPYTAARYQEGRRWREVVTAHRKPGRARLLDVGGANGAIELAMSADEELSVFSVETLWNGTAHRLSARSGRLHRVVADASRLPFRGDAFDVLICIDTFEHLKSPERCADEMSRVTRPGGTMLLTTPPRWRYALRRDPHFQIRGLLLFPPAGQRAIAARRGWDAEHHYVDRIYASTAQLLRLFPPFRIKDVLSRSRAPKRWSWDAIVFEKKTSVSR